MALVVSVFGATLAFANHGGDHASCNGTPVVQHDDANRVSKLTIPCDVPYPDQPTITNTETVTVPGPTETVTVPGPTQTVTVTASPTPSQTPTPTQTVTPTPTPTPTNPPGNTLFGANPVNPGGESASAAQGVVTKFGSGATVRQFLTDITTSGGGPNWPAVPAGSLVHRSYKPTTDVTNAQIDALIRAAQGHWLTFWHESDNDGLSSSAIASRTALMNRLYDRNVALGRLVTVVHVVTGQFMSDYRDESWKAPWRNVKADLIGVDMDGPQGYGVTYADELSETLRWIQEESIDGYVGWTVPEFGVARTSSDSNGSGRLAWMQREVDLLTRANPKPRAIHWYDYMMTNDYRLISGTQEYNYWRGLVATND